MPTLYRKTSVVSFLLGVAADMQAWAKRIHVKKL